MNDKVSNVPPLDFLGPSGDPITEAAFQLQFGLDRDGLPVPSPLQKLHSGASSSAPVASASDWASTLSLSRSRPASSIAPSSVSGQGSGASVKRGSGWFAPLLDKLGFTGSKGRNEVTESQQRNKLRSKHMSLPTAQTTQSQPLLPQMPMTAASPAGKGETVRPSKEEVMENYKSLVASGFFEQHAIHSTRKPAHQRRPVSGVNLTAETTSRVNQLKPNLQPVKAYVPPPMSPSRKIAADLRTRASFDVAWQSSRGLKRTSSNISSADQDAEATSDTEANTPRKLIKKSRQSAPRESVELKRASPVISTLSALVPPLKQRGSSSSLAEGRPGKPEATATATATAPNPRKSTDSALYRSSKVETPPTAYNQNEVPTANTGKKVTKKSKKLLTRRRSRSRKRSSTGSTRSNRRTSSPSAGTVTATAETNAPLPRPLAPRKVAEEFARPPTRGKPDEPMSRTTSLADLRSAAAGQGQADEPPLPEPPMPSATLKELRVTTMAADAARAARPVVRRRPVPLAEQALNSQVSSEIPVHIDHEPESKTFRNQPSSTGKTDTDTTRAQVPSFHYPRRMRPQRSRTSSGLGANSSSAPMAAIAVPNRAGVPTMPGLPADSKPKRSSTSRKAVEMVDASGEVQRFESPQRFRETRPSFDVREEDVENRPAIISSANWSVYS
jgi:hypothetical protein